MCTHKLPAGATEATLGGLKVVLRERDGYVNATHLCKDGGKEFGHWNETDKSKAFLEFLSASLGIPVKDGLVQSRRGGSTNQGTWVHPLVAVELAYSLDSETGSRMEDILKVKRATFKRKREKSRSGCVYIVTADWMPMVKIGMWRGTDSGLLARYKTSYGPTVKALIWETKDALEFERDAHDHLVQFWHDGELYHKECLDDAKRFLTDRCGPFVTLSD